MIRGVIYPGVLLNALEVRQLTLVLGYKAASCSCIDMVTQCQSVVRTAVASHSSPSTTAYQHARRAHDIWSFFICCLVPEPHLSSSKTWPRFVILNLSLKSLFNQVFEPQAERLHKVLPRLRN
jgi:hypothetical protein